MSPQDTTEHSERPRGIARRHPRWHIVRVLAALILATSALGVFAAPAHAAPQADTPTVEMPDPSSLTFRLRVRTDVDLASATLNYKVLNPDGNVGGSLNAEVSAGRTADLAVRLPTINNERYIPVGTQFAYTWTLVDKNGASLTTPEQKSVFLEGRYQWQSRAQNDVTVYWYGPNEANAMRAMEATAESIARMEKLLRVKISYPIRVVLWRNSAEAKAAQQPRASTFDSQVITGGARVASDVIHVYDPLRDFGDVTRHEAAHLVTKVAGDGPFTSIPSWLDEGTAVYAQSSPGAGYEGAVRSAIQSDQAIRLRSMAAPSNQPGLVDLFYGQSWAVVKFIVDKHGEEKFAAIFKAVKDGSPIDDALTTVIGQDQDGLYNAWRQSVNLKTIDYPPVARATQAAAQATQPPLRIPTSVAAAGGEQPGGGQTPAAGAPATEEQGGVPTTAIIIGVVTLLLAGGLGFLGMRLAGRKTA